MKLRLSHCNLISSTYYWLVSGSIKPARGAKTFFLFVFRLERILIGLVVVWCSWCQLPSVYREEVAFVEKGAFDKLCVLIIDVTHSL